MNAGDRAVILEAAEMAGGDLGDLAAWLSMRDNGLSEEFRVGVRLGQASAVLQFAPSTIEVREVCNEMVAILVQGLKGQI